MDYKNGKIYRLVCEETGRQYIGSTCSTLVKRLSNHKRLSNTGRNRCTCKDFVNPKIILIEDYPCDRKEQLLMRERHFIETIECVNYARPIITDEERKIYKKEWTETNKEHTKQTKKDWCEKHKEYLKEQTAKYYQDHKEEILEYQQKYRDENREQILEYQKNYRVENREKINEKKYEKITCECGCIVARANMSRHKQSKKHINLLN